MTFMLPERGSRGGGARGKCPDAPTPSIPDWNHGQACSTAKEPLIHIVEDESK